MTKKKERRRFAWSLWIPVILAFLFVIGAWSVLIKIAAKNPVETIEIQSAP